MIYTWSEAAPTTPPPSLIVHPASTIILDNEEVLGDEDGDMMFANLFPTKRLSSLSVKNQIVIFYVYFCKPNWLACLMTRQIILCRTKLSKVGGKKRSLGVFDSFTTFVNFCHVEIWNYKLGAASNN